MFTEWKTFLLFWFPHNFINLTLLLRFDLVELALLFPLHILPIPETGDENTNFIKDKQRDRDK